MTKKKIAYINLLALKVRDRLRQRGLGDIWYENGRPVSRRRKMSGGSKEALERLRLEEHYTNHRNQFKISNHADRLVSLKLYFPKLSVTKAHFFSELEHEYGHLFNDDFEEFLQALKEVNEYISKMPGAFETKKKEFKKEFAELASEFQHKYQFEGASIDY